MVRDSIVMNVRFLICLVLSEHEICYFFNTHILLSQQLPRSGHHGFYTLLFKLKKYPDMQILRVHPEISGFVIVYQGQSQGQPFLRVGEF